jgi:hypothetical protein
MTTKTAAPRTQPNEAAAMTSRGGLIRLPTAFPVGSRAGKSLTNGPLTVSRGK